MKSNSQIKRYQQVLGWIAVGIVLVIASLWAYWGGVENFYEGWYSKNIWENIFMMLIQYWLFAIIFIAIGLIGIRFRIAALIVCILLGIGAGIFFAGASFSVLWVMVLIPITGVGLLFFFGRPRPRRLAYIMILSIPIAILLVTSIVGLIRISNRVDDGYYGTRVIQGRSICLVWAPRGPGWPDEGVSHEEASYICRHLSEDGTEIKQEEVGVWRLPTVEEAVDAQMLHGENVGGIWYPEKGEAKYKKRPDKETPLWDPHSMVIYYWTSDIINEEQAYMISYNGTVSTRYKDSHYGYLSFRAVKDCKR